MAKNDRSKKIWHLPKRGSVHQTIAMIHIIDEKNIDGARWNPQKQELLGTEIGKAGLSRNGRALTHQSVRTLLANMPQYLGFVFKNKEGNSSKLNITKVGFKLLKTHPKEKVFCFTNEGRKYENTIDTYIKNNVYITESEVFKEQLLKLIITNPNIKKDCEDILLFPFRFTLKLLLELNYLDKEELAYIVFHSTNENSINSVKERILSFREQKIERRKAEINEYCKTEEGQLTLVKAPTAGYYMELCASSGLCEKDKIEIENYKTLQTIKLKNKDLVIKSLEEFKDIEAFNFGDDIELWSVYFGDPDVKFPPFNTEIKYGGTNEVLVTVSNDGIIHRSFSLGPEKSSALIPVFSETEYQLAVIDLSTGKELGKFKKKFDYLENEYVINLSNEYQVDELDIAIAVTDMFSRKSGFDKKYESKLLTLGKHLGRNFLLPNYKGGRLEFLFSKLLDSLESSEVIDSFEWNGRIGDYGLALPALGGKQGYPDLIFEIDKYLFVLELTTIRSNSLQWSAEGASVPEHIEKIKKQYIDKQIIGIFSAPKISPRVQTQLDLHLKHNGISINFIDVFELSKILQEAKSKQELIKKLV